MKCNKSFVYDREVDCKVVCKGIFIGFIGFYRVEVFLYTLFCLINIIVLSYLFGINYMSFCDTFVFVIYVACIFSFVF